MRRAALERRRVLRRWREHVRFVYDRWDYAPKGRPEPGRLRKGPRLGACGRPRCWLCHPEKLLGRGDLQTYRAALSHWEWGRELGLAVRRPRKP